MMIRVLSATVLFAILLFTNLYAKGEVNPRLLYEIEGEVIALAKERDDLTHKLSITKLHSVERTNVEKSLTLLADRENRLVEQYQRVIGGKNREAGVTPESIKSGLLTQLEELLTPLLEALKRVSAKPREIDRLLQQIDKKRGMQDEIIEQQAEVKNKLLQPLETTLHPFYQKIQSELEKENAFLEDEIEALELKIAKLKQSSPKLIKHARNFIVTFIQTKGRNLFFALALAVLTALIMQFTKNRIFRMKFSVEVLGIFAKPLMALYDLVIICCAYGVFCLTLYLLNDWLLFTLAVLFLAGFIWSFKQILPKFLLELKVVLNLGPIREGERISWLGLPYDIKRLGFFCTLENALLEGGVIRVPVKELMKINSRSYSKGEALFPTKVQDLVLLPDEIVPYKVMAQTPESVTLKNSMGASILYKSVDFYSMGLKNITEGETLIKKFSFDYALQAQITEDVVKKLQNYFIKHFLEESAYKKSLSNLQTFYASAESSSLLISVVVDVAADAVINRAGIMREMEKNYLEFCNENHYSIPFNQLTVHMSGR